MGDEEEEEAGVGSATSPEGEGTLKKAEVYHSKCLH